MVKNRQKKDLPEIKKFHNTLVALSAHGPSALYYLCAAYIAFQPKQVTQFNIPPD